MSMPKLAVCVGHNKRAKGAYSETLRVSEYDFNSRIADEMCLYGGDYGLDVMIFTRNPSNSYHAEMRELCDKVNKWYATAAMELHFNADAPRAHGTETLYYHRSDRGKRFAACVQAECLSSLGLRDRGIKRRHRTSRGSKFLLFTAMPAIITEPFFGSNAGDSRRINSTTPAYLAHMYLRGAAKFLGTS